MEVDCQEGLEVDHQKGWVRLSHQRLKLFVFSDFRDKFTNFSSSLLEFKSVGIFAISFFVTEIRHFSDFRFFLTVYVYLLNKHCQFLQCIAKTPLNSKFGIWNFFDILYRS